jgi:hypothetical protein
MGKVSVVFMVTPSVADTTLQEYEPEKAGVY